MLSLPPRTLLPLLLGGALGAAGWLQGLQWRAGAGGAGNKEFEDKLRAAHDEIALLKRENEALRSLAQGGGEVAVPKELAARVEREAGLKWLSSPVVHRLASEELRDRIAAALESRFGPSGIDDRQLAYQAIGWLGADDDLLFQMAAWRAVADGGWFDDVTGEAWVTDRFEAEAIPDQALLVKLLTRIVLQQHFPPPAGYPGDDAARAREALHEGAGAAAAARYLAAQLKEHGFMPTRDNPEAAQLLKSLPRLLQGLAAFPGTEGRGLAESLYVKGNEPFQNALRQPPVTTGAVSHPGEPASEAPALSLPALPEEPFLTESAGWLGLKLWLDEADAGLADAWRADRYVMFPDGESSTAVLWEIELADAAAADLLQAAALRVAGRLAGGDVVMGSVRAAAEGRHLAVSRPSPTRLRFLNTATAASAAAWVDKK